MKLVIVESPAKAKTIEGYLGSGYKVISSVGHIRDLGTNGPEGLGIDVKNNFEPTYKNITGKSKVIKELKDYTKKSDQVLIATDPDREGEAIAWHIADVLKIEKDSTNRIIFNEINKQSVQKAILNPRSIDIDMFNSQQARRMIDRIVGFKLSKLLQQKIKSKSAGRVQSVALKIIVDLEREREKFVPEEYWNFAIKDKHNIEFKLLSVNEQKVKLTNNDEVKELINKLILTYQIEAINNKDGLLKAPIPYTTSTLQQDAANKINFNTSKTMRTAQKLYEGIKLSSGVEGLITYMRTDSTRISNEFKAKMYNYIEQNFGKEYIGYIKEAKTKGKVDNQDAHEAIRVTNLNYTPNKIKDYLTAEQFKLYYLIYERTLASAMKDAKISKQEVIINNNDVRFKATGQKVIFNGFLDAYQLTKNAVSDTILPNYQINNQLENVELQYEQKFTEPPARFTEAKLVKKLEELGIGRPSTYASIIDTLKKRLYVEMAGKTFIPTEQGIITVDALNKNFNQLMNVEYTSQMEEKLDKIATEKTEWVTVVKELYEQLTEQVTIAYETMEKVPDKPTGEMCPLCEKELVIKRGRYGEFIGCSGYPECKYIKKAEKPEQKEVADCPKCGGKIVKRTTKRGKIFYGCANFPKCKEAYWNLPSKQKCEKCGSLLTLDKDNQLKCEKKHDD